MNRRALVSFSCGAASAVAAKMAVEKYGDNCEIIYCDTLEFEHSDNLRFLCDVEKWTGKKITILKSEKYIDIYDVFYRTGWLVGPGGTRCTRELKIEVRKKHQRKDDIHILGYPCGEEDRISKFQDNFPDDEIDSILVDAGINKSDCYHILNSAGIELPMMYKLGYNNNNCIGCVKGQGGYWNKIRVDFPEYFEMMATCEREMDVAICKTYAGDGKRKRIFLDELDPDFGRNVPLPDIECGMFCVGINKMTAYSDAMISRGET